MGVDRPTTTDVVPFDDMDQQIYQARIVERMSWRQVGVAVGMSHEGARQKYYEANRKLTRPELEDLRQEENDRLDDLESKVAEVATVAVEQNNIDAVLKATAQLEKIHSARARLNGLIQPQTEPTGDPTDVVKARLEGALNGFLAAKAEQRAAAIGQATEAEK